MTAGTSPDPRGPALRAELAYAAMQRHLYLEGAHLYREAVPVVAGANPFAYLWPFEEAAKATLGMAGLPDVGRRYAGDVAERQAGREAYWQPRRGEGLVRRPSYASYPPPPLGQGGDTYFDDNCWVALDLVQYDRMGAVHGLGRSVAALDRARQLFDLVAAGWCADRHPYPGGVFWVDAAWNRDRGAAVTAGLAALAVHLHELTAPETPRYLDIARRAYAWLRETLLVREGPLAGLYHDKVLGDGAIDPSQWIYNQGVPVAAGVLLHRATGDAAYLEQAVRTADAALAWYGARQHEGQPLVFGAIFFRNLLLLAGALGQPSRAERYRAAMHAYAERAWEAAGVPSPDAPSWSGTLLDLAAVVQLWALLGWPPEQYALLA